MGHTRRLAERLNLPSMRPRPEFASTGYCLVQPGKEYVVYQPKANERFTVELIAGTYRYEWLSPAQQGQTGETGRLEALDGLRAFKPPFDGDAVLYLKAATESIHQ